MKILKQIARKVLYSELAGKDNKIAALENRIDINKLVIRRFRESEAYAKVEAKTFKTQVGKSDVVIAKLSDEVADYKQQVWNLKAEVQRIKNTFWNSNKIILSQSAFSAIVGMLPDSNRLGTGQVKPIDMKMRSVVFVDSRGKKENNVHIVELEIVLNEKDEPAGVEVSIKDYNIKFTVFCGKRVLDFSTNKIKANIDSYVWDWNATGVQTVSDEGWNYICNFIEAQNSVLSDIS